MSTITDYTPHSPSPFLVEMNKLIDKKLDSVDTLDGLFTRGAKIEKVTTESTVGTKVIKSVAETRKILPSQISLQQQAASLTLRTKDQLEQVPALQSPHQSLILDQATNITDWVKARSFCTPDAIDACARTKLKLPPVFGPRTEEETAREKVISATLVGDTNEEKFLNHVFNQILLKSNKEEIEALIKVKRSGEKTVSAATYQAQTMAEKVSRIAIDILTNPVISKVISIASLIGAYVIADMFETYVETHYYPIAINAMINHLPGKMVRVITDIYAYRVAIFLSALVLTIGAPPTSMRHRAFTVIRHIIFLPYYIAFRWPLNILLKIADRTKDAPGVAAHMLDVGYTASNIWRVKQELAEARKQWITEVKEAKIIPAT